MDIEAGASPRTLADLKPGETGIVAALRVSGADRRRMMDLGIVPGTSITAAMRSPLGDPTAYRVRGALIGLRRIQAERIEIQDAVKETTDHEH